MGSTYRKKKWSSYKYGSSNLSFLNYSTESKHLEEVIKESSVIFYTCLGMSFHGISNPFEDPGMVSNSFEHYICSLNIKTTKSGKTDQRNEKCVIILVWNWRRDAAWKSKRGWGRFENALWITGMGEWRVYLPGWGTSRGCAFVYNAMSLRVTERTKNVLIVWVTIGCSVELTS
jgi:hypothetical protein